MLTLKLTEEALVRGMGSISPDILRAVHTLEANSIVFAIKWGEVWIRSNPEHLAEHLEKAPEHVTGQAKQEQAKESNPIKIPSQPSQVQGQVQRQVPRQAQPEVRLERIQREKGVPRGYVWKYVKQHLSKMRVGERMAIELPEGVSCAVLQNKISAFCGYDWGAGCYITQQHKERGVVEVWRVRPPA